MDSDNWIKKKVLIMVKAYPQASQKYLETVCTAGITEDKEWIRLYPLPFRSIGRPIQFKKYQWVEFDIKRNVSDNRIQSYRPNLESIKILSEPLPTKNGWELRNEIVLPTVSPSLEYLRENYPKTSLGIIRPREIINVVVENVPHSEANEFQQLMFVFGEQPEISAPLKSMDYKFSYVFLCDDKKCTKPHKLSIIDWELGALVYNLQQSGNDEESIKQKVINKFFNELCSPSRDTHLILGNKYPYKEAFMVLGVYYPEKNRQLSLFEFQ